ncbi:uncharacterized protein LOC100827093 [Brachypodium distachyon]|uniref:Late embryogenesis abundant protein LEA-2 subgroup domain-containing protein n=1 Tax=Brachypodium distachyon TaxID=15368 RepID=I1IK40_BRADI|nr:uncharacterized protein LOC100827093 [Brachypodium distachyon]KQJ87641.1 hypothetical protein BRADI_4g12720v3 [Brachypodium distachyon]|eukprot:XP_003575805.1 uncharacterized protein LOC100827093 [Brachypodium distachyon]
MPCSCLSRSTQKRVVRCLNYSLVLLLILAAAGGILALILAFAPVHQIEVTVEDARLNTFSLAAPNDSSSSSLFFSYNIAAAVAVRNPNWAMTIQHTEPLVASVVFHGRRLHDAAVVAGAGSKHRPRETRLHRIMAARERVSAAILLGDAAAEEFRKENATGVFDLEVLFSGEIKYLGFAGVFADKKDKLGFTCPLSLQLAPPGDEVVVFREVGCRPDKRERIYY